MLVIPNYEGVCNVDQNFRFYFKTLTNKVGQMIEFKNLPENVDEEFLKEQLILCGKICFTQFNQHIYALNGNIGGEPNCYYESQDFIIANPVLGSKTVKIRHEDGSTKVDGLEGILVGLTSIDKQVESLHGGLYDLIYQTAGLLADNVVSLNCAQINSRVQVAFVADDEALANTGEKVLKDMYNGKPYKILTQDILNKLTVSPIAASGTNTTIMSLIEAQANIWQNFYNQLGLSYNGNLKRERINTAESELMTGSLNLNLQTIIENLKADIDKVNELFGTSIEVDINPDAMPPEVEEIAADEDKVDGIEDRADDKIEDATPDSENPEKTEDDLNAL